jgi:hypothetical protein
MSSPVALNNLISVKGAAEYSGYSLQFLRPLLWNGKLAGLMVSQVWLIENTAFEGYLEKTKPSQDKRFGCK